MGNFKTDSLLPSSLWPEESVWNLFFLKYHDDEVEVELVSPAKFGNYFCLYAPQLNKYQKGTKTNLVYRFRNSCKDHMWYSESEDQGIARARRAQIRYVHVHRIASYALRGDH